MGAEVVQIPDPATAPCRRFFDDLASLISFTIHLGQLMARLDIVREPSERGIDSDPGADVFRRLGAFSPVLLQMAFTRGVDAFQIYLSDMLGLVFTTRPETLRSREEVKVEEILQHRSLEELVSFLATRRVERMSYPGLTAVARELENDLSFPLFETTEALGRAVQIVEARNLIVHNRGVINTTYLRRVPEGGVVGDELGVDAEYVLGSLELLAVACADIDVRAAAKFGLPIESSTSLPQAVATALKERKWFTGISDVEDPEDRN